VWALAKTLWVLLVGQELPLPGTHRPAEPAHALRERITFTFAAELDLLLEKATLTEPEERVSMDDMAHELQACIAPPPEARPSASLGELHSRIAALTATSRQHLSERQDLQGRIVRARQELATVVREAASDLNDLLTFYVHSRESGCRAAELLKQASFTPDDAQSAGWLLLPPGEQQASVEVVVAMAFRMLRRRLCRHRRASDLILTAWPGQWSQDVFEVDDIDDVRREFGLIR
jgi:hypothetical protein